MFYLPSKERNFDTYRSIIKILHNFAHSSPSSFLLNNVLNIILEAEGCDDWCACECRLNLTIIKICIYATSQKVIIDCSQKKKLLHDYITRISLENLSHNYVPVVTKRSKNLQGNRQTVFTFFLRKNVSMTSCDDDWFVNSCECCKKKVEENNNRECVSWIIK